MHRHFTNKTCNRLLPKDTCSTVRTSSDVDHRDYTIQPNTVENHCKTRRMSDVHYCSRNQWTSRQIYPRCSKKRRCPLGTDRQRHIKTRLTGSTGAENNLRANPNRKFISVFYQISDDARPTLRSTSKRQHTQIASNGWHRKLSVTLKKPKKAYLLHKWVHRSH